MTFIKVVGYQFVHFAGTDGKDVTGKNVFYLEDPADREGVVGTIAGKMFLSSDRISRMSTEISVGDTYEVRWNRYGKPEDFFPAPEGLTIG